MTQLESLRFERLAFLIGTTMGQIAELLNNIQKPSMSHNDIYLSLKDIHDAAALQIHELYYKGNKP